MSTIVGAIGVKVYPDTKAFGPELLAKLNALEDRMRGLKVGFDGDDLSRKMTQAARNAERAADKIKLKASVDEADLATQARNARQAAEAAAGRLGFKAWIDSRNLASEARRAVAAADAAAGDIEVDVKVNQDSLRSLIGRFAQLSREMDVWRNLNEDAYRGVRQLRTEAAKGMPQAFANDVRRISAELAGATTSARGFGRALSVEFGDVSRRSGLPRLSQTLGTLGSAMTRVTAAAYRGSSSLREYGTALSNLNVFKDVNDGFEDMLKNLDRITAKTAFTSAGILHFGGVVGAALPVIASFAQGLGEIVRGAGLALPGMLAGMAVGAIAFAVALKDFNKQLPEVSKAFRQMAKDMSPRFWAEAQAPMREMFRVLLPGIARGMNDVSTSAGKFTGALADGMRRAMEPRLPAFFKDVAGGIDEARRGTEGFSRAFGVLMTIGAAQLPRFGAYMSDVATKWGDFLTQAEHSGKLTEWVDTGILRLRQFGSGMFNLGRTVANVNKAIADSLPTPAMETFAASMDRLQKKTSDPQFQANLTKGFTDLRRIMEDFDKTVGPAFSAAIGRTADTVRVNFSNVMDGLGQAMRGLFTGLASDIAQAGLNDMLDGISDGLRGMSQFLPSIGVGLGALGTIVGDLARQGLPLMGQALTHVSNVLHQLQPGISEFINAVGPSLQRALAELGPKVGELAGKFSPLIGDVGKAASELIDRFTPALGDAFDAINAKLTPKLVNDLGEAIKNVGRGAGDFLAHGGEQFVSQMERLNQQDLEGTVANMDRLSRVMSRDLNKDGTLFSWLSSGGEGDISWIKTFTDLLRDAIDPVEKFATIMDGTKIASGWLEPLQGLVPGTAGILSQLGGLFGPLGFIAGVVNGYAVDIVTNWSSGLAGLVPGTGGIVTQVGGLFGPLGGIAGIVNGFALNIATNWHSGLQGMGLNTTSVVGQIGGLFGPLGAIAGTVNGFAIDVATNWHSGLQGMGLNTTSIVGQIGGLFGPLGAIAGTVNGFAIDIVGRWDSGLITMPAKTSGIVAQIGTLFGPLGAIAGVVNGTALAIVEAWGGGLQGMGIKTSQAIEMIGKAFGPLGQIAGKVNGLALDLVNQWTDGLSGIEAKTTEQVAKVPDALEQPIAQSRGLANTGGEGIAQSFGQGLNTMGPQASAAAQAAMAMLGGTLLGVGLEVRNRGVIIGQAFGSGLQEGLNASIATATAGASTTLGASFTGMGAGASLAGTAVGIAFGTGLQASMTAGVTTAMTGASAALSANLVGMGAGASLAGTTIGLAFGLALQASMMSGVTMAMTAASVTLNSNLTGMGAGASLAGTTIGIAFGLALQTSMVAGVTTAMAAASAALNANLTGLGAGASAAGTAIGIAFGAALQASMVAGVSTATAGASAALSAGIASMSAAASAGSAAITAGFQAGIAPMPGIAASTSAATTAALQGGLAPMPGIVSATASASTAALQGGLAPMPGIAANAGTGASNALRGGLAPIPGIASSMASAGAAALNSGAGAFYAAGANLGRSAANGLRSQVGAVQAAASAIIAAANAAARAKAQIASPSKVWTAYGEFMGEGLAIGLDREVETVAKAAKGLVDAATRTLPDEMIMPLSIEAKGSSAQARNLSRLLAPNVAAPAEESRPVEATAASINVTNYYPQAEPTSVTINKAQQLKTLV